MSASRQEIELVEAALISFMSPDGSERMKAAFSRRIDRVSREIERLTPYIEIGNEVLAPFVRFWLTANEPLPNHALSGAQAKGKGRQNSFV